MTHLNQRKILFLANVILAMSEGNLVEAYEILVGHIVSSYLSFGISYGARRGAKKLGQYLLGPLADLPVIGDYIITCPEDKIMQRSSKLIADGVSVIGTATTDYVPPDLALGAAGQVCGQAINEYEKELREQIARVMEESQKTDAWMQKYIAECTLGNETVAETVAKLRGGQIYFDPNQKRYFILKIIGGVFIVLVTIILIKGRSKVRKFFKKIHPKKVYTSFKKKRYKKFIKDKEKLELLYAM